MRRVMSMALAVLLFMGTLCGCGEQAGETLASATSTASAPAYYPTSVETEKSFYSDGVLASEMKFIYDLDENLVGANWEEYFEDGSLRRSGYSRSDRDGKLLESKEESYFSDRRLEMRSFRKYDEARDTMTVEEAIYLENGTPQILVDGVYNADCSILVEGKEEYFYPNGTLCYSHEVTADRSTEVYYQEDGEVSHSDETTYEYDTQGNLIRSFLSGYDRDRELTYTQEVIYSFDEAGNMRTERSRYGENGQRLEEQLHTWEYDETGKLLKKTSTTYLRGKLLLTEKTEFTYNAAGQRMTERTETIADGQTYITELVYEYDENGNLLKIVEAP